ncbi:MAG: RtcB family protein [Candidatus Moranbacteria bacterium]|nr:RtcB family protein [Candidatus Moranbacteria bacterium]
MKNYNLKNISPFKKELQADTMKVPVIFHASEDLLPKEEVFKQLEELAQNEQLFNHVAALSDAHSKKGLRTPAGVVAASENYLFPQLVDAAPNCGMRLILTDLSEQEMKPEKVDQLFRALVSAIPTKKYIGKAIPSEVSMDVFRKGSKAVTDYFSVRTRNELENTFKNGNAFTCNTEEDCPTKREIRDVIPSLFIKMGRYRLGILGATESHFLSLMKVKEIFNDETSKKLNIRADQYAFLMHTGSGIIGRYIASLYTPVSENRFLGKTILRTGQTFFDSQMRPVFNNLRKKIKLAEQKKELFSYEDQSIEGRMFIAAFQAASNYGFANRAVITHQLDLALEQIFQRPVDLQLLYDTPHVYINQENHFGKNVWVHRNGATRALFGEPILIAPLVNTLAYVGVGTDKNESTFFSANHEIGKADAINLETIRSDELSPQNNDYTFDIYRGRKKTIGNQNTLYQQYAEKIVEDLASNNIMNTVAALEPVVMLTY